MSIPFGSAQEPMLWDYADKIDTMDFLNQLQFIEFISLLKII